MNSGVIAVQDGIYTTSSGVYRATPLTDKSIPKFRRTSSDCSLRLKLTTLYFLHNPSNLIHH